MQRERNMTALLLSVFLERQPELRCLVLELEPHWLEVEEEKLQQSVLELGLEQVLRSEEPELEPHWLEVEEEKLQQSVLELGLEQVLRSVEPEPELELHWMVQQ
jgi:hypothetical protein